MLDFQEQFDQAIDEYASANQYNISKVPSHTHNRVDSLPIDYTNLANKVRFVVYRALDALTNTSVLATVGGDYVMPYNGYVKLVGATVDTAGTTGDTTIDIKKNGVSIILIKITINSGSKTSRNATVQPILNQLNLVFLKGDIFTFNVDGISTTPAKGLTIFMNLTDTTTNS